MAELLPWEYGVIALLFVWGGFVRSGLGFGGAVLTLPFLLLIRDEPLLFLPIISVHLLFFSGLTVWQAHRADAKRGRAVSTVNWEFLRYALPLMLVPKLIGVAGVITLPGSVVTGFIFCTVTLYAISYILGRPFKSNSKKVDAFFFDAGRLCEWCLFDRSTSRGAGGGESNAQGAVARYVVRSVVCAGGP